MRTWPLRPTRPAAARPRGRSWDDNRITALQEYVLAEPAAMLDIAIAKPDGHLLCPVAPQYADGIGVGERRGAPRQAHRLHDINGSDEGEVTGRGHLTDAIDAMA